MTMSRLLLAMLGCACLAHADRGDDLKAAHAIRSFNLILAGRSNNSIDTIKSELIPVMKRLSPRFAKSIRFQLDRGYHRKYSMDGGFLDGISEILAAGGKAGIAKLWKRYKAESKRDEVRLGIARALGGCGDDTALSTLLKCVFDKTPEVAAAAVLGCRKYPKVAEKRRKGVVKTLVGYYVKVTAAAAGKLPDSRETKLFKALRPAMNEALKSLTHGESLDSAEAWNAWLRENLTRPWTD